MQQLPLAVFLLRGVLLLYGYTPVRSWCDTKHVPAVRYLRKVGLQLDALIGVRECLVIAAATHDITVSEFDMISVGVVCALLQ